MTSPDNTDSIRTLVDQSTVLKEQAERFAKLADTAFKRAERYKQYSDAFMRAVEVLCDQAARMGKGK